MGRKLFRETAISNITNIVELVDLIIKAKLRVESYTERLQTVFVTVKVKSL